jgi:hypothetical protein
MADIQVEGQWLVSPNKDIEVKWMDVAIQERKSRIIRFKQDIEDLTKGKIVELQAKMLMLEKELAHLETKRAALSSQ